ncbi:MAG: site-specific integrase [Burkholderiaceae bacterium]|nr:site-specific integrase [Burkholderiaceae bacterium]
MKHPVEKYIEAATRDNTRRSYQAAARHFEVEWGGFLPATADSVARYLADYAGKLAVNTLQQRVAALAQWHVEQGFPDPTKAPVVRKVLKGIRTLHPAQEKRARPLQLEQITQIAGWLDAAVAQAACAGQRPAQLRHARDRALLLIGFWRGFRGDELTRLQVEHIKAVAGQGMICFLPFSKGDRQAQGKTFKAPALARLCPVEAYLAWIEAANLSTGPVFRGIDRWGHVSDDGLHINSLIPLLRSMFDAAGVPFADQYSSHSLRRGFANWATSNGWDLKTLMEYVGWHDVHSAMRYVEASDPFAAVPPPAGQTVILK